MSSGRSKGSSRSWYIKALNEGSWTRLSFLTTWPHWSWQGHTAKELKACTFPPLGENWWNLLNGRWNVIRQVQQQQQLFLLLQWNMLTKCTSGGPKSKSLKTATANMHNYQHPTPVVWACDPFVQIILTGFMMRSAKGVYLWTFLLLVYLDLWIFVDSSTF